MSEALVAWLFSMISGPVFAAVAVAGVSALCLLIPPIFK